MCPRRASLRDKSLYSPSHSGTGTGPPNDQSPMTSPVEMPSTRLNHPTSRLARMSVISSNLLCGSRAGGRAAL